MGIDVILQCTLYNTVVNRFITRLLILLGVKALAHCPKNNLYLRIKTEPVPLRAEAMVCTLFMFGLCDQSRHIPLQLTRGFQRRLRLFLGQCDPMAYTKIFGTVCTIGPSHATSLC